MTQCDERYKLQLVTQVPELNNCYLCKTVNGIEGENVVFDGNVIFNNSDIKGSVVSYVDTTGVITFNEDGRYLVEYYVISLIENDGIVTNMYFVVKINGTSEPKSLYGGVLGDIVNAKVTSGQFIYTATAGDTMELVNRTGTEGSSIIIPQVTDSKDIGISASIVITKLNN
ncbi:hypothetical protein SH2C18_08470 [Clostridium sediminicola]|uniref:hypothetical protein n=1 Tax=Clostridium sediminicola TaxID=3114879 RepID=UPI0031F1D35B